MGGKYYRKYLHCSKNILNLELLLIPPLGMLVMFVRKLNNFKMVYIYIYIYIYIYMYIYIYTQYINQVANRLQLHSFWIRFCKIWRARVPIFKIELLEKHFDYLIFILRLKKECQTIAYKILMAAFVYKYEHVQYKRRNTQPKVSFNLFQKNKKTILLLICICNWSIFFTWTVID
jgi:hypothetical protein